MSFAAACGRISLAPVLLFVALALSPEASAVSNGITGLTNKTPGASCGSCHGAQGGNVSSVAITGPASLAPSQAGTYTITANQASAANGVKMGFDVAASDTPSPLSAIAGQSSILSSGEVIHNLSTGALHTTSGGSASYTFTFTMPAAAAAGSTHTIYGVSALSFTGWNHAPNFTVTTKPANPSTLTNSNVTSASVDLSWTGGGPEYRVVYKTGAVAPTSETDGTQVTLGAVSSTNIAGLSAATQYTFKVFSKLSGQSIFSASGPTTTITTTSPPAATRHVNAATGVNTGNCASAGSPCKTITYAMGQAVAGNPGDIISVAPGTYNVALGEAFPITFKAGVQLVSTGTPFNTIIDGAGDTVKQGLIKSNSNNSAAAKIDGFTFANGLNLDATGACPSSLGGALYISSSSATFTISRNIFTNNEARGFSANGINGGATGCLAWGGAIYTFSSAVNIINNVFTNNVARGGNGLSHPSTPLTGNENGGQGQGGALYLSGTGTVKNNSFRNNSAIGGSGGAAQNGLGNGGGGTGGGVIASGNPVPSFINNIFASNFATSGSGGTPDLSSAGALYAASAPTVTNNLFFNNLVNGSVSSGDTTGTASLTQDPQFHNDTNLRLRTSSPARGAGTTSGVSVTVDLDAVARPNPPAIGAFESSLVATTTGLSSNANPAAPSQSVTFTADVVTLADDEVPGTVTFKDGGSAICSNVALALGSAQCATSSLSSGAHSMTAEYSGNAVYAASTSSVLTQNITSDPVRLGNISTRAQVQTGFDLMIGGFVISGSAAKTVVIRAIGPSLANFGVSGALSNPQIQLVRQSDGATIATNDDWQGASNAGQIQSSGFAPSHPLESAIFISLMPGAYTAIVSGVNGATGVGLVEVYEVDHPEVALINISTRAKVQTGFDVMIGGFVIQGSGSQTVVIRAIGPSLANFGVSGALQNPTMQLVRISDNATIATNDDWQSASNASQIQSSGFAPSHPQESAIMITLAPGAYTAVISGVNNGTGVGLVEVYKVTP
jgi:hypothetical protein